MKSLAELDGKTVGTVRGTILHSAMFDRWLGCVALLFAAFTTSTLDGARIGHTSLVAAGSLVSPGTQIPPRSLVMGVPAKVKRQLTDEEADGLAQFWQNYVGYTKEYKSDED